ncbi:MAG: hypothetical protein A2Y07_05755 [Planctomycetes bacterium GWF2_50_10]|nr:MAG: hypothetical protein A2Y07_05755 [Planctomycetes bacterium GWF2_50_10]
MRIKQLHSWDITYAQARLLQSDLAGMVQPQPFNLPEKMLAAGLDCAFSKDGKTVIAAVVVLQIPGFALIESAHAAMEVKFPYIPGLLSFREIPACIAAIEKLTSLPDVFLVDGQGIAHPRRLGIAAHLGIILNLPTIGCAKSRLIGEFKEPRQAKGSSSNLYDKDELIGAVLRTRKNVKPLFVSVGNLVTLEDSIKTVLTATKNFRLPEPARLAHQTVTKLKTNFEF